MEMDVMDAVAGVVAAVEDQAQAALEEAALPGDVPCPPHQPPHQRVVAVLELGDALDVAARDDQHVGGGLGVDVVEGQDLVVLEGDLRGHLPLHDLAEQAGHGG